MGLVRLAGAARCPPRAHRLTGAASLCCHRTYPCLSADFRKVLKSRSDLSQRDPLAFTYSQFNKLWHYEFAMSKDLDASKLPRVNGFSVFVLATEFFPEKYEALTGLLSRIYASTGDVMNVLQAYMKVYVKGSVDASELGSFAADSFDLAACYLKPSVKNLAVLFGSETVLVWAAMLMGKRIVVYADQREALPDVLRTLPLLVWHRKNWSIVAPLVLTSDEELAELTGAKVLCFGVTTATLLNQDALFDLALNLSERRVTVAGHAQGDFSMGPFVQDLASFLVESASDAAMESKDVVKALAVKTGELLKKLRSMGVQGEDGKVSVTAEGLAARGLPPNLQRFLYNVALAEGLVQRE